MSELVAIPRDRWEAMEQNLQDMKKQLSEMSANIAIMSLSQPTTIVGKREIAKVIGCPVNDLATLQQQNVFGVLLWRKEGDARNIRLHLDRPVTARQRYIKWQDLDNNVRRAISNLKLDEAEEYWKSRFNL